MFDIVLENARIVDGTGNPWFFGDIGIKEGTVKQLGDIETGGSRTLDIDGLVACPGFIDMHSHSDMNILTNPRAKNKIMQGITTEVTGNCGISPAPVNEDKVDQLKSYMSHLSKGLDWSWRTLEDYFSRVAANGLLLNIALLVGEGTLRIAVMGFDERKPTGEELDEMRSLLEREMEQGAFGLSTGLIYPPGLFTETDELIDVARVLQEYDGLYSTHVRGESSTLIGAVEEAIKIGKEVDVKVEISHHKACGKSNWGKVKETLKLIDKARTDGVDVTGDQYPYTASSTTLGACLPPWAHEGGTEKLINRLADPKERNRMRKDIEERTDWDNPIRENGWENILVASVGSGENKDLEGMNLQEISKMRDRDPFDLLFDLLRQAKVNVSAVLFEMNEEDVRRVMKHPTTMFGSDGSSLSPSSPEGKPHPRNYGTYPRILGKYVRENEIITLEKAIRKMTSFPAQKLGIKDRGLLREGYRADVVVFDPDQIMDKATYEDPHRFPEGINYVFVNGKLVVEDGDYTGKTPGKVLKKNH
ncbi:D-aminoacylase [Candidatus Bipolaricaulota bacterium]|nr:D-aminoacylase [Candidatus Bipolaricaulota bacterium]